MDRESAGRRVLLYVDGFNLYFGMKAAGLLRFCWLDVVELGAQLLMPGQTLVMAKYFTALIQGPEEKRLPKAAHLEALHAYLGPRISVVLGRYQSQLLQCRACGVERPVWSEKKTDVNIAVELVVDAFEDRFDTAILVTADSDLVPAIEAIRAVFPAKRVVVAFPPERRSKELRQSAHAAFPLGRAKLAHAQLPDLVTKPNGVALRRPPGWRRLPEAGAPATGAPRGGTL